MNSVPSAPLPMATTSYHAVMVTRIVIKITKLKCVSSGMRLLLESVLTETNANLSMKRGQEQFLRAKLLVLKKTSTILVRILKKCLNLLNLIR